MKVINNKDKFLIAFYGGSGSGKTTVAKFLAKDLNYQYLDADKIGHFVLNEASSEVEKAFPSAVIGGVVDRKKLGDIVFNDKAELERLNNITLPKIESKIKEEIAKLTGVILLDGAIINKSKIIDLIQLRVLLSCDRIIRVERLVKNRNIEAQKAEKMVDLFKGSDYDILIDTSFGLDCVKKDLLEIFYRYKEFKTEI